MSNRLRARGHIVLAVVFTVLAAVAALWGGQWQAKKYDGTPLGLFVADGDTTTTGYLEADTAAVDTAHFLKASVHRLDGWRAGIDTLHSAIDSTSALYVNTANTDQGYAWLENYSLTTATDFWGIYGGWYKEGGASDHKDFYNGIFSDVSMDQPGGVIGGLYGFSGISELANGQMGTPDTSRYLMGGEARTNATGGTLYGSAIGFFNEAISYAGIDSITGSLIGTWVHTQSAGHVGGQVYGILLDDDTGTDWGIYQTGTSPNYLWGLDLGDSLTVAGNVHALAYYGDGSHLTGIVGGSGDTTGLRAEWRVDIGDTANALRGEWRADIAESLAVIDLSAYMLAADFPDSFATAWPAAFTAAMTSTIAPAIHDTAEVLRGDISDSLAVVVPTLGFASTVSYRGGALALHSVTSGANLAANPSMVSGDTTQATDYVYLQSATHVYTYSISDGVLSKTDSIAIAQVSGDGGVWGWGGYVYAGSGTKVYCLSNTAGDLAKTDSVTVTGNVTAIHGIALGDSVFVFVTGSTGYLNVMSTDGAGDLRSKSNTSVNSTKKTWDVHSNTMPTDADTLARVFVSCQDNGIKAWNCSAAGTLTAATGNDPGAYWCFGVWSRGHAVWASYIEEGVRYYDTDQFGNCTLTSRWAYNYCQPIWGDAEGHIFVDTYNGAQSFVASLMLDPPTSQLAQIGAYDDAYGIATSGRKTMWDDGTYLYVARASGPITTLEQATPFEQIWPGGPLTVYTSLVVDSDTLWVTDGAAYSYTIAGADWVTSSSRKLKDAEQPFGSAVGEEILGLLDRMPIQRWRYKSVNNRGQHVGPMAEDWYAIARQVAPEAADSTQISQEHVTAALLLAVQALGRRNDSLEVELASAARRVDKLERAWDKRDSTGRGQRPPRVRTAPERPEPQPRRGRP